MIAPQAESRNKFSTLYGSILQLDLVGFVEPIQFLRAIEEEIQNYGDRQDREPLLRRKTTSLKLERWPHCCIS
jgi:hypothetical protein